MTKLLLQAALLGLCTAGVIFLVAAVGGFIAKAAFFIGAVVLVAVWTR